VKSGAIVPTSGAAVAVAAGIAIPAIDPWACKQNGAAINIAIAGNFIIFNIVIGSLLECYERTAE